MKANSVTTFVSLLETAAFILTALNTGGWVSNVLWAFAAWRLLCVVAAVLAFTSLSNEKAEK